MVHKEEVPEGKKLFDYAWAMKKKPSGIFRAQLAARGLKQEEGKKERTIRMTISHHQLSQICRLQLLWYSVS